MPARGKRAREPSASDVDELTALHRSRLVDWHPVPVVALAPSSDSKALAVGCENGRVELWDAEHDCCLVVSSSRCCVVRILALDYCSDVLYDAPRCTRHTFCTSNSICARVIRHGYQQCPGVRLSTGSTRRGGRRAHQSCMDARCILAGAAAVRIPPRWPALRG